VANAGIHKQEQEHLNGLLTGRLRNLWRHIESMYCRDFFRVGIQFSSRKTESLNLISLSRACSFCSFILHKKGINNCYISLLRLENKSRKKTNKQTNKLMSVEPILFTNWPRSRCINSLWNLWFFIGALWAWESGKFRTQQTMSMVHPVNRTIVEHTEFIKVVRHSCLEEVSVLSDARPLCLVHISCPDSKGEYWRSFNSFNLQETDAYRICWQV